MKKFIYLIGLVFLFNSSVAFADKAKTTYFNLSGMVVNSESLSPNANNDLRLNGRVTDKSGFGFSMALGQKLFKNFRVEAQYARRDVSINVKDKTVPTMEGIAFPDMTPEQKKAFNKGGVWSDATRWTEQDTPANAEGISTRTGRLTGRFTPEGESAADKVEVLYKNQFSPMSTFFDEDNLIVQTIMANGYYDLSGLGDLTPYVGAGIGIGFINLEDESNFAYQVMAGVSYKITDSISSNVGWTFLDAGEVEIDRGGFQVETDTESHSIDLGITYSF